MGTETRGSISFFTTYRPPVALDIFSCAVPPAPEEQDELPLTDGKSYNYNGRAIPPAALKAILRLPKLSAAAAAGCRARSEEDVDSGRLSGTVFVSERGGLETLHVALRCFGGEVQVFSCADLYPAETSAFRGVRMEDSGCFAAGGDYLVHVTTKDRAAERRQPWTAVYSTNLRTGRSERLTPSRYADLSPSLSPSGNKIAVASFQRKDGRWDGEIEDLKTNIFVMNVTKPSNRKLVVKNGGWPTWGSDAVLFFHRKVGEHWAVYRLDIGSGGDAAPTRVTPEGISAVTPAAIDATTVAVATVRRRSEFSDVRVEEQCRHIEIFCSDGSRPHAKITQRVRPLADHFNPFVMDGGKRIGYHHQHANSNLHLLKSGKCSDTRRFQKLESPHPEVGLYRAWGVFPTFNKDGSKVAFVDNDFASVWVADTKGQSSPRVVYRKDADSVFSPVWSQNPEKDTIYVCKGHSFKAEERLDICALVNVSDPSRPPLLRLIADGSNNAFPSTNPDGTKLVFRSTRDGGKERHKNLYIMMDADSPDSEIRRLTEGAWTDTQCQWSPSGDWIVFSSNRDKPDGAPELDNGLDPGYFAVFMAKWDDPSVVVRVITSANDVAGHVNHPFFSPDGKSLVVTADLAAVSADPMSLPVFVHSVRPYGDIFTVDVDPRDIRKNADVKDFRRLTHSRYENSTGTWSTMPPAREEDSDTAWTLKLLKKSGFSSACPM
ncbi:uncharacterized protein M6B38_171825 [Iris pallida]|uniref:Uncharacterized protein n=1 Tax=Iris pallida TaxID=29817 RepID=A0AAX6EUV4_IRIPA|nr:uncharacterized protein M6B38_171825 [Iris pallida]